MKKIMLSSKLASLIFSILILCFAVVSLSYAAWTAPTSAPPNDTTTPTFLNTGDGQIKQGGLLLGHASGVTNGLLVENGNVGIGTTSPATKLDVNGTARMTGFQLGTSATNGYVLTTNASGVGTWQAPSASGSSLWTDQGTYIYPNNYNSFVITDTGKIGINTTSPGYLLDVVGGNVANGGSFHLKNLISNAIGPRIIMDNSGGYGQGSLDFYTVDKANPLSVNPSVRWLGKDNGLYSADMLFQSAYNGGTMTTNMTILGSNGNLGIGTTSPGAKLEVNGTTMIDSGGSANHAICWKADGKTLGYCSTTPTNGVCTCN